MRYQIGFGGVHFFSTRARSHIFISFFSLAFGKEKRCHKWVMSWPDHAPKAMRPMSIDATVHETLHVPPAGVTFYSTGASRPEVGMEGRGVNLTQ